MVKNNHFEGATLSEAISKATAVYRCSKAPLEKKTSCAELALDLAEFKREASRALDRAEDLMRKSEGLAEAARREALQAVVNAAIAAAGAFGTSVKALRALKALRFRDLSRRDWIGLVPIAGGGFLAAANALDAIRGANESARLAREARQAHSEADRLGGEILRIADEYRRSNCEAADRTS